MAADAAVVDAIIPAYREDPQRLRETVRACLAQDYPIRRIIVVDDGSPQPVSMGNEFDQRVQVMRFDVNGGVARARNSAAAESDADYLLFVNAEVQPAADWVRCCVAFMSQHPEAAVGCGRIRPARDSLLSQWRMRFQEEPYERTSGSQRVRFATGHAVLFRRQQFQEAGGYDPAFGSTEDCEICERLSAKGFATYVVDGCRARSLQRDEAALLAKKRLRHEGWMNRPGKFADTRPIARWPATRSTVRILLDCLKRNLATGRVKLLPVDIYIAYHALKLIWGSPPAKQRS